MAVNLINGDDTAINQTNDDIQIDFSANRSQQITQISNDITMLKNASLKKLWENETPSATFGSQNITLTSGDYDYLLFFFVNGLGSGMTLKGNDYKHGFAWDYNGGSGSTYYTACYRRNFLYVNDTTYNVSDCYVRWGNNTSNPTVNTECIPLAIYGGKLGG